VKRPHGWRRVLAPHARPQGGANGGETPR
jgi:hypothetical protein